MASSVLLRNRLRRQIHAKVWPVLQEAGFIEFAPLRAFRVDDGKVETVEFVVLRPEWREPRWIGGEAYANGATFNLHVGTYFLGDGETHLRPRAKDCHCRATLSHDVYDSACDGRTFWPGHKGEALDEAVEMAIRALKSRGLDHLRHYAANRTAPSPLEEVGLSTAEAAEMMRICREGRAARAGALEDLHRRLHLADEHTVVA